MQKKVLIIGAGVAGKLLLDDIVNEKIEWEIVGFVDDIFGLKQKTYKNKPILGSIEEIGQLVEKYGIDKVIIAVPSEKGMFIRKILLLLGNHNKVEISLLPRASEVVFNAKVSYKDLCNIDIIDIVGEMIIKSDQLKLKDLISNKIVFITGGGGSIGSELSKQIFLLNPRKIIILDCVEKNLFLIKNIIHELRELNIETEVKFILGNINNTPLLKKIFEDNNIDLVFHAAAYKHVSLVEENIYEGAYNNISGTYIVARLAGEFNVDRFMFVSTDKAVAPTNIMGKTKRVAERTIDYLDHKFEKTIYTAVRFGNVFNSSGSVVELFLDQLNRGNILTITDPHMTRYFMTIPEAVHLVLQASFIAEKNRRYILEMGDPINVLELARCLTRIKGKSLSEIDFKIIGSRPGEKKHEILFCEEEEICENTTHKRILSIKNKVVFEIDEFSDNLNSLLDLLSDESIMNHSKDGEQNLSDHILRLI